MDYKPLIKVSELPRKRQQIKLCPWAVAYAIFTALMIGLLVHGLQMRGVI